MQFLKREELVIPENRQRRHFDAKAIRELAQSIKTKGLMHPLVVQADGKTLVAGERRSKAIDLLISEGSTFSVNGQVAIENHYPVILLSELSDEELYEAELEENVVRMDLTWQEKAAAVDALHKLRISQKGERSKENPGGQSASDTVAELLGRAAKSHEASGIVTTSQQLAAHLDDPEVAGAKTMKEALSVIKKKAKKEHLASLAANVGEHSEHEIIEGDVREKIAEQPDGKFDIILTDPPYGVDADSFGTMGAARHAYTDSLEYATELMRVLSREWFRVTKPQAHLYIFCDIRYFPLFAEIVSDAGFDVFPTPLIWCKGNQGMVPLPEHGPRRSYEAIIFANKGKKKVNDIFLDTISVAQLQRPNFGAEKPWKLYYELLKRSAHVGARVLDCFAGAGPLIHAASNCSCKGTLIELNPEKVAFLKVRSIELTPGLSEGED